MNESKFIKVGALVNITTPRTNIPHKNYVLVEVHPFGIVARRANDEYAPVTFYSWDKLVELEFVQAQAKPTLTRTAGGK